MQIAQFTKANLSAICKIRNVFSDFWSTVIKLCNLCKLHNLQKLFSIWVQSAKWRNAFQICWRIVPLSICVFVQIAQFAKAVFNLSAICKMKKCLSRSSRWRIVPLSICVICANCTICKSCFQFECRWICKMKKCLFRFPLRRIVPLSICVICAKLHNLQKLFSIWVQSAKWRNVFSDLLVGGSYPYQFV